MDEDTRTLIIRAQARDQIAQEQIFIRYRERLRRALRPGLGAGYRVLADSEDAVHDGIMAAVRRLDQFEYRGEGSFLAWLLRGAVFEVRRRLRAQVARKRSGPREPRVGMQMEVGPTPSEFAAVKELEERVALCLDQMPEREREVIVFRRYLGLTAEDTRSALRLPSSGAVRALLSRAQARLAQLLDSPERPSEEGVPNGPAQNAE